MKLVDILILVLKLWLGKSENLVEMYVEMWKKINLVCVFYE